MNFPYLNMSDVVKCGYGLQNALIERIDLNLIGHFGNIVTLELRMSNGYDLFRQYNATASVGILLQCLYDLLDLSEENGRRLSSVRDIPCRLVSDGKGIIGVGHFIKDKFVTEEDFFQFCKKIVGNVREIQNENRH